MGTANHACRFTLKADHFDLDLLVHSHGWIRLVPFSWDDEQKILSRHETVDGKIVYLSVKQVSSGASVSCTSKSILRPSDRKTSQIVEQASAPLCPQGWSTNPTKLDALRGRGQNPVHH